jgi:hypothetical protein
MNSLASLHRAVGATLASGRLGRPVFVRYTLQGLDRSEAITSRLTQITATVRDWLGQPLEQLYALGTIESGQVALTLRFRDGATALVSFARAALRGDGVDLFVLGNHGAIYHDAGSSDLGDDAAAGIAEPPDPLLQATIEKALHSGKPEPAGKGAAP